MAARPLLLALLLGAACVELPPLASGVCGNGVIDRDLGEDCDGHADPALGASIACGATCRYACGAESICPTGWGCGADGVCAQPSGAFGLPVDDFPAAASAIEIAEVDGDGGRDLLGHAGHQVWARFGDGEGHFRDVAEVSVDVPVDTLATGDLDADGDRDVVIPVPSGIVALLGDARDLAPVTYRVYASTAPRGLVMTPIAYDPTSPFVGVLTIAATGAQLVLGLAELAPDAGFPPLLLPDTHGIDELTVRLTARLAPGASESLLLGFQGESRVRIFTTSPAPPYVAAAGELTLPGPLGEASPILVDQDGDGRIDLVVTLADGRTVVAHGTGAGGFTAATVDARFAPLGPDVPIAAGDLDGDGDADWVTSMGVYVDDAGALRQTGWNVSDLPWLTAATPDLDGDGIEDVVAATGSLALDVLRGTASGLFVRANVVTEGSPHAIAVGDYDGDGREDAAMIEEHPGEVAVTVLFGSAGELHAPVEMGDLPAAVHLSPALISVSASTTDATTDLFVQTYDEDGLGATQALALFVGSSARRMLAPFSIGADPVLVAIGNLAPDELAAADVLALTTSGVVLATGDGEAGFVDLDFFAQRIDFDPRDPTRLGLTTRDLDGDRVDEVLALVPPAPGGGGPASHLVIGRVTGAGPTRRVELSGGDLPGVIAAHAPLFEDLDGDGAVDLVVLEGDAVTVFWGASGAFDLGAPTRVALEQVPLSVATLQTDADGLRELAVGTRAGVVLVDLAAGRTPEVIGLVFSGAALHVAAGDLTGDGLDDLVVHDGFDVQILPALPAREGITVPEKPF